MYLDREIDRHIGRKILTNKSKYEQKYRQIETRKQARYRLNKYILMYVL